jgi:hypothetical protein
MRKQMTLEQKIIQAYAPGSCLLDLALENSDRCNRYLIALEKKLISDFSSNKLIQEYPLEALLSPVGWIRERAQAILGTEQQE